MPRQDDQAAVLVLADGRRVTITRKGDLMPEDVIMLMSKQHIAAFREKRTPQLEIGRFVKDQLVYGE